MNHNLEIKLQAWLDGELPSDEAQRFSQVLASDPEAQQLAAELKGVKAAVKGNELEVKVPATREFYWSQIERQIRRETPRPAPSFFAMLAAQWRRFLVPVAGAAAGVALLAISVKQSLPSPAFVETTDTANEMEALTFHDQSAGMTVVWLRMTDLTDSSHPAESVPDFFDLP